jgi:type IV fimbrial biogenesis protein FimT
MDARSQRGFTLYELLITVFLAGIILGLGVPNLLEFARNNRMSAAANDMITAILLARNEAVTGRLPVTLCASPNPLDNAPDCDADLSDSDTQGGYFVWIDEDGDAVLDAGERIIRQQGEPEDIAVFADSGFITFDRNGYLANPNTSASAVLFCDARGNTVAAGSLSAARGVQIDPLGRARILREVAEVQTLDAAAFGNLACP